MKRNNITTVLLLLVLLVSIVDTYAQDRQVYGTVFEKIKGEETPIPGVIVKIPGYTIGTQTGADGTYRLSVPEGASSIVFEQEGGALGLYCNVPALYRSIHSMHSVWYCGRSAGISINLRNCCGAVFWSSITLATTTSSLQQPSSVFVSCSSSQASSAQPSLSLYSVHDSSSCPQ